mmetsp:Transcript_10305/g.13022  ORF Transcript_10305/g.13022 Transcript_10305/m.13022 type:complete len:99 (-) Transcript_10305:244-540(-)
MIDSRLLISEVNLPVLVTPMGIGLGWYHSCVSTNVLTQIYCWGAGRDRQFGNGGADSKNTPALRLQSLGFPTYQHGLNSFSYTSSNKHIAQTYRNEEE